MPMMTCAECGASVSTTAHSCPACGAGRKAMIGRRPITPFGWAWRGLLAIIALLMIITQWHTRNVPVQNTVDPNPVSPVEEAAANARLHSATHDVIALKHGLRDPASLQLTHVLSSDTGDLVCIRYRARNGFGGMTLDGVVFVDDTPGSSSRSLWRRKCMHGGLHNITDEVSYAIDAIGG